VADKAERKLLVAANGLVASHVLPCLTAVDLAGLLPRSGNDSSCITIKKIDISAEEPRELGRMPRVLDWLVA
jgi:hypothetical protein